MAKQIPAVPQQVKGGYHDTISQKDYKSESEAIQAYKTLKDRFLNIDGWSDYSGILTATFRHLDKVGNETKHEPEVGDLVRIDVPGPGNFLGEGYDWIKINKIDQSSMPDEDESLLIQAVPTHNPDADDDAVAHFYDDKSTSNFRISRSDKRIIAAVHGRNEVTNNEDVKLADVIRNTAVSQLGKLGIAKIQWKALTDGLLDF